MKLRVKEGMREEIVVQTFNNIYVYIHTWCTAYIHRKIKPLKRFTLLVLTTEGCVSILERKIAFAASTNK